MAKFKVYYTIELNEVATHIFESNDFEVKRLMSSSLISS